MGVGGFAGLRKTTGLDVVGGGIFLQGVE